MTVDVNCTGTDFIDYKTLLLTQGKLKIRTKEQLNKLVQSIIEQGFSFPFFVWRDKGKNHVLDGHGRIQALNALVENGYTIPDLPAVYIEAENLEDAKIKLLKHNSIYGSIDQNSLKSFSNGFSIQEIEGLEIKTYDIPEVREAQEEQQETQVDIDLGAIKLNPDISASVVTEEDIKIAEGVVTDKKPKEIETIILPCKCCGKSFEVRKSDIAIRISDTLYEREVNG